jgi:hypothetical protein
MALTAPTVRVVDGDGFITINEADFDLAVHTRYITPEAPHVEEEKDEKALPPVAENLLPSQVAMRTGEPVIPDFSTPAAPVRPKPSDKVIRQRVKELTTKDVKRS